MSGIYQLNQDTGSVTLPSSGNTFIGTSTNSELYSVDSSGTVTIYGTGSGGGSGFTPSLSTDLPARNITASANISSSGTITAGFYNIGNQAALIASAADTLALADETGGALGLFYTKTTNVTIGTSTALNGAALGVNGNIYTNSHITASGNISSSGDVYADKFISNNVQVVRNTGGVNFFGKNGVSTELVGNVTASGNISSSGTVTALTGSFGVITGLSPITVTDSITFQQPITASGNISSSGTISMLTASIGGGIFTSASLAAGGGGGGSTDSVTKSFPAAESIDNGRAVSVGSDGAVSNTIVQGAEYVLAEELGGTSVSSIEATSIGDNKHIITFYDSQSNSLWAEAYTIDGSTVITGSRLGIGDIYIGSGDGTTAYYYFNISSHQSDKALLQYYDTAHVDESAMFPTTASFMVLNVDGSNTITTSSRQLISGSFLGSALQAVNDNEFIFLGLDAGTMNAGGTVINADNSDVITPAGAVGTISSLPQSGSSMLSPAGVFNMAKYDTNKAIAGLVRQDKSQSPQYYKVNIQTLEVSASVVNAYSQSYVSLGDTYDPVNGIVNLQVSAISSSAGRYGTFYIQNEMSSLSQLGLIGISSSLSGSQTVDVFNNLDSNSFNHSINEGDGVVRVIQAITDEVDVPNVAAVGRDSQLYTVSPAGGGSADEKATTVSDSILGLGNGDGLPDINMNTSSSLAIVNYNSDSSKFAGATAVSTTNGFEVQGTNNALGLVGLAAESGTSGSNVSVTIAGVNSSQTSLTPGNIYLLQDDGTLEAYEDSVMESGVQIGTAISSTEIIVNPIIPVGGGSK